MISLRGRLTNDARATYEGYRVSALFREKSDSPDDTPVDIERSGTVVPSGEFTIDLAERIEGDVALRTFAPDGEKQDERTFKPSDLSRRVSIPVIPKPVFAVESHPDPNLAKRPRTTGLVFDLEGNTKIGDAQVLVWGRATAIPEGSALIPLVAARTDSEGRFSFETGEEELAEAVGEVAFGGRRQRVHIPLESNHLPAHLLLPIEVLEEALPAEPTDDDCACATPVPRAPGQEELTVSSTYSQDLTGGQCVTFTVPNRTLEEFSFYSVVRTTEPEIKGFTLSDTRGRVTSQALSAVIGEPIEALTARTSAATLRPLNAAILKNLATSPDALTPARLAEAEQHTVFGDLTRLIDQYKKRVPGRGALTADNPIDWDDEPTFYQASTIAHGHLLHFKQVWKADGYSVGDLLYSLPLAPCQKKQIAIVDWERRELAARSEELVEEEMLEATLTRDRDISEIVNSTLKQTTRGGSSAGTWGAAGGVGALLGPVLVGIAGGGGGSSSTAWQNSSRSLGADSLQQLRDQTMQSASAMRSQRSTVIQTAQQGESMRVQTEVVANHNHCHAITVQYFEVLRHFLVNQEMADVQECLFVPLLMSRFDRAKALRWREPLMRALRRRDLRGGFEALERMANAYAGSDFPSARYCDDDLEDLSGEARLTFSIPRPTDKDEEFDPEKWGTIAFLTNRPINYWYSLYLDGRDNKDLEFQREIAPRIAAAFVQRLELWVLRTGSTSAQRIDTDWTLVSNYRENAPLQITVRLRLDMPSGISREGIRAVEIRTNTDMPSNSKVVVQSLTLRYRTAHMSHTLLRDFAVLNDLSRIDSVVVTTPLDFEEQRNPREEDRQIARQLIDHLNEHLEYYHQAIWLLMDPERRYMLLDGFIAPNAGGRSVASVVENRVIGIAGNSMIFPVVQGFNLDPTYRVEGDLDNAAGLLHHYAPLTPIPPTRVSVPTRGVFAESVMGSCNSCEEKDDTRFWRFEESPCRHEPTPIQPVSTASRTGEEPDLTAKDFPTPMINLQNAPAAPAPTGLAEAIQLLGTANVFRDITGLEANQRNALAAFNASMETAKTFASSAGALAMQQSVRKDMDKTLQTIRKAETDGLISKEKANEIARGALQTLVGDPKKALGKLTDKAEVKELIRSVAGSDKGAVALSDDRQTVSVRKGETGISESFDVNISGDIPVFMQSKPNSCWAAVLAMLLSWRNQTSESEQAAATQAGAEFATAFQNDTGLTSDKKPDLLSAVGLIGEPPQSYSVAGMRQLLESYGPLWVTTDEDPSAAFSIHARIVTGIFGDGTPDGTSLRLIDPGRGTTKVEKFHEFMTKFESEASVPGTKDRIQVVHWPAR